MVSNNYRSKLVSTTSALALAITAAAPAFAQQEAQGIQLEEIIVNARRVEENIQRVPIAITAFSADKLVQQDVKDVWSLTKNIGGINICCSPGNVSYIFIRGVNFGAPTYFADVPQNAGGFSNFFDVSNVQVLKGPQGTLFGQASNGGALVYQPTKPGESLGGFVTVTGGNYKRRSIEGAIDVPIIDDKVLFRMAAQTFNRDGYVLDIRNGKDINDQNYYILRPSLTIRPMEGLENYTLFQFVKSSSNTSGAFVLTDLDPGAASSTMITPGLAALHGGAANFTAMQDQVLAKQIGLGSYKIDGNSASCTTPGGPAIFGPALITNLNYNRVSCPSTKTRGILLVNTTTYNLTDDITIKNIFGYSRERSFSIGSDTDGTPLNIVIGTNPRNNTAGSGTPVWSDELQLQGKVFNGLVNFTVGTFHTGQTSRPSSAQHPIVGSLGPNGLPIPAGLTYSLSYGNAESASVNKASERHRGVYGQANVDMGQLNEALDGLTITAGYRYSWDFFQNTRTPINLANYQNSGPSTVNGAHTTGTAYVVSASYQFNPDVMFYVTNAKGYSYGGFQNFTEIPTYQPDSLNNIEAGVKGTFDVQDIKIRSNVSYYYGFYKNAKIPVTGLYTNPTTLVKGLGVATQNAEKSHIQGLDADVTVIPTDWAEIGGGIFWSAPKFEKWTQPVYNVDISTSPFSFTPKWKWMLRGTLHASPFLDQDKYGDVSITANLTHTGKMWNVSKPFVPYDPLDRNTALIPSRCRTAANGYGPLTVAAAAAAGKVCVGVDQNPGYYNLDLAVDWKNMLNNDGLNGQFFMTNVTKNEQNDGGCYCQVPFGLVAPAAQVPRMFGFRVNYSF